MLLKRTHQIHQHDADRCTDTSRHPTLRSTYLTSILPHPPTAIYRLCYIQLAHAEQHRDEFSIASSRLLGDLRYLEIWHVEHVEMLMSAISMLLNHIIDSYKALMNELNDTVRDDEGQVKHTTTHAIMTTWRVAEKAISITKRLAALYGLHKLLHSVVQQLQIDDIRKWLYQTCPKDLESIVDKLKRREDSLTLTRQRRHSLTDLDQLTTARQIAQHRIRRRWIIEKYISHWLDVKKAILSLAFGKVVEGYNDATCFKRVWLGIEAIEQRMIRKGEMPKAQQVDAKLTSRNEKRKDIEVTRLEEDEDLHRSLGVKFVPDGQGEYMLIL
ncbi:hypothetical protein LTR66_017644, partial [Elasticomyces elasticus]